MITSTLNGEAYRQKFSEEIKAAIEETKNRWSYEYRQIPE